MRATLPTFRNASKTNPAIAIPLGEKKMSKFTRFFAISLLVFSMSAVALADGGETQGPGSPAPGETQGPGAPASSSATSTDAFSSDFDVIIEESEIFAHWVLNLL
jgi:hypothetical protein